MPMASHRVLRLRHWLPGRLRLRANGASAAEIRDLAEWLGADWHRWSGSLLLSQPPPLNALAALVEERGWWLEAPSPFADAAGTTRADGRDPEASNPWEQMTLEVGASLIEIGRAHV